MKSALRIVAACLCACFVAALMAFVIVPIHPHVPMYATILAFPLLPLVFVPSVIDGRGTFEDVVVVTTFAVLFGGLSYIAVGRKR